MPQKIRKKIPENPREFHENSVYWNIPIFFFFQVWDRSRPQGAPKTLQEWKKNPIKMSQNMQEKWEKPGKISKISKGSDSGNIPRFSLSLGWVWTLRSPKNHPKTPKNCIKMGKFQENCWEFPFILRIPRFFLGKSPFSFEKPQFSFGNSPFFFKTPHFSSINPHFPLIIPIFPCESLFSLRIPFFFF